MEIGFNKHSISAHAKFYKQPKKKSGYMRGTLQFSSDQWNEIKYTVHADIKKSAYTCILMWLFFSNDTCVMWRESCNFL